MNPDVAEAIPDLVSRGLLAPQAAPPLARVARGELLSLRAELRAALYIGVLTITGGVSILVAENLDRIGPVTIAGAIGTVAALLLVWVARHAPPFSWQQQSSPHLAFDYVLLLGALLAAADLAYIEWKFTPLGEDWPRHLLAIAVFYGVLAVRYDSRALFSLALSSFAAWRGVSVRLPALADWLGFTATAVRWNTLGCGALFVLLGWGMKRSGKKAHFEPVATYLGWLLILATMASGGFEGLGHAIWSLALLASGGILAFRAFRGGRFWLFALGLVSAYIGLSQMAVEAVHDEFVGCGYFLLTSALMIAGLIAANLRLRRAGRSGEGA